jgi:hypothetical protein
MLCTPGIDATPTYPAADAGNAACHRAGARSHRPRHQRAPRNVRYYLADPRRPGVVVAVRGSDVQHCPAALKSAATLATAAAFCLGADRPDDALPELCPEFAEASECPNADRCPRVHAARCTDLRPHRRAPPADNSSSNGQPPTGMTYAPSMWPFFVAPHNTDPNRVTSTVDPTECFITKAVDPSGAVATPQRPLEHCAHFVLKGLCLFGADCGFVHHVPRRGPAEENTPAAIRTLTARPLPALAGSYHHYDNTAVGPSTAPQPRRASLLQVMSPTAPEASSPAPPAHRRVWHNPYGGAPGWREQ